MGRGRFSYRLLPDFHGLGREGLLSLVSQDAEDLESREREDGVCAFTRGRDEERDALLRE